MEKIKILALVTVIVLFLFGCGAEESVPLDCFEGELKSELSWSVNGERIRAIVILGNKGQEERDISVEFIEPESLCGVRVERTGGKTSSYIGDTVFDGGDISHWLCVETLFDVDGNIVRSESVRMRGEEAYYAEIERPGAERLCVYISKQSGAPIKLIAGELEADVIYFNVRS